MSDVLIYTTAYCGYCVRAKQLLDTRNIPYREIRVDAEPERRDEMIQRSGRRTVPQVFIGDEGIGGFDELYSLHRSGRLDSMTADGNS